MLLDVGRALILLAGMWSLAEHLHVNSDEGIILGAIMVLFIERSLSIVQETIRRKE